MVYGAHKLLLSFNYQDYFDINTQRKETSNLTNELVGRNSKVYGIITSCLHIF